MILLLLNVVRLGITIKGASGEKGKCAPARASLRRALHSFQHPFKQHLYLYPSCSSLLSLLGLPYAYHSRECYTLDLSIITKSQSMQKSRQVIYYSKLSKFKVALVEEKQFIS